MTAIIGLISNYAEKGFEVPELAKEGRDRAEFKVIVSAIGDVALLDPEPLKRMMAQHNRQFPLDDYQRKHYSPAKFDF